MSGFTIKPLTWHPYIEPVDVETATERQRAAMQVTPSNGKVSAYVRTLVHDPESYTARTKLYNTVMYSKGGLPQVDRELGALAASALNGCAYCASVHARRHIELAKTVDTVRSLYLAGSDAEIGPRERAIVEFSRDLSRTPAAVSPDHIEALRAQGLSPMEIIDLIHATAIFGWANRLMHTLGHATAAE